MIKIDFKNVKTKEDFHSLMRKALNLSDYYGDNLDSLWDLLSEYGSLEVDLYNSSSLLESLGSYGEDILNLFEDLAEEGYKINIFLGGDMLIKFKDHYPQLDQDSWVSKTAVVTGDTILKKGASIWYNTVIRGDLETITIGECANVQDNSVIHADPGLPTIIGKNVTIGHGAIIHGCIIEENSLVGMGAIILNGAHIGKNCIVGAGALVTEGKVIPDNSLVVGSPAKVVRLVREEEIQATIDNALDYYEKSKEYKKIESEED